LIPLLPLVPLLPSVPLVSFFPPAPKSPPSELKLQRKGYIYLKTSVSDPDPCGSGSSC
jgi:hypothetical protein